jgi:membrane dipeptidase
LLNGWETGDERAAVSIEHYTAHIDYICQLAGDTNHAAIGSDFDGGFGLQSAPDGIDSIADLGKIVPILSDKGYSEVDIEKIMSKNWLEKLNKALPETL